MSAKYKILEDDETAKWVWKVLEIFTLEILFLDASSLNREKDWVPWDEIPLVTPKLEEDWLNLLNL